MYRRRAPRPPQGAAGGQIVLPEPADLGRLVVRGSVAFARRNKMITGAYFFGILSLIIIGGGTKLSLDQAREYNRIMDGIDVETEYHAEAQYYHDLQMYRNSRGWFWSCDNRCQRYKQQMNESKDTWEAIRAEGYNRMSDAKAVAGLFSEVGVGEVKDSFWHYFTQGKNFAKRQTMWDMLFVGIGSMSRDETMVQYIMRIIMAALVNFSIGLVMAFFIFIFGLWSIVRSYQPNPLVAVLFFLAACCAAFAFVATYLIGIYGATAGTLYGVAKVAESSQRQQRINAQRQQQRMQYRPQYE